MAGTEQWVTIKDVATHLQISQDSIRRWIAREGMPASKAGRAWRFKLSEVDEWMRSTRGGPGRSGEQ